MLYCNKEKSQELFSVLGLQSSKGLNDLDFNIIIHKSHNIVNSEAVKRRTDMMDNYTDEKIATVINQADQLLQEDEVDKILAELNTYKQELFSDLPEQNTAGDIDKGYDDVLQAVAQLQTEIDKLENEDLKSSLTSAVDAYKADILSSRDTFLRSVNKAIEDVKSNKNHQTVSPYVSKAQEDCKKMAESVNATFNQTVQNGNSQVLSRKDSMTMIVVKSLLLALLKKVMGLENVLADAVVRITQKYGEQQLSAKQQQSNVEVVGLYRRENGDEFIHYAVNSNGKTSEHLTNGVYSWSDNKNAERIAELTRVESIDTDRMEKLMNKYQPDQAAMKALDLVKTNQKIATKSQMKK